jgi:hypothetical protein
VFDGGPGPANRHLLIGLGVRTAQQGQRVEEVLAAKLVNELDRLLDGPRLNEREFGGQ